MGRKKKIREADWRDWIDANDEEQVTWAIRYLRKKGLRTPVYTREIDLSFRDLRLPPLQSQMEHDQFIDLMKKAWKGKKARDKTSAKGQSKPLHIYLSHDALNALDAMSQRLGRAKKDCLESLILNASKFGDIGALAPRPMTNEHHAGASAQHAVAEPTKELIPSIPDTELRLKVDHLENSLKQLQVMFLQKATTHQAAGATEVTNYKHL